MPKTAVSLGTSSSFSSSVLNTSPSFSTNTLNTSPSFSSSTLNTSPSFSAITLPTSITWLLEGAWEAFNVQNWEDKILMWEEAG